MTFEPQKLAKSDHPPSQSETDGATSTIELEEMPFRARAQLKRKSSSQGATDAIAIEIKGTVSVQDDNGLDTDICIWIRDITEGPDKPLVVLSDRNKLAGKTEDFCYRSANCRLPKGRSVLSDWTEVVAIPTASLSLARKGKRKLDVLAAILAAESSQQIAVGRTRFDYQNPAFGYVDIEENRKDVVRLTLLLAGTLIAADKNGKNTKRKLLADWYERQNVGKVQDNLLAKCQKRASGMFENLRLCCFKPEAYSGKLCAEFVEIAPLAERLAAIELCFQIAAADRCATAVELTLLCNIGDWLGISPERFRSLMERLLPATIHEIIDLDLLLGITGRMDKDALQKHLSKEYGKWNSRVTHADNDIRQQTRLMLDLISHARARCGI